MIKYLKIIIVLLIFLLLVTSSGCDIPETSSDPDNSEVEEVLKNEFGLIPIMPNAIETEHDSIKKKELVVIGASYTTNRSYKEIVDYYYAQLREHGWEFYKEEKVKTLDGDLGGKSVRYKKGDFVATVQYAGEKANYGWTYGFSMDWGLRNE